MSDADTVGQPPSSSGCEPERRVGSGQIDALRPACASWMPAAAPCERMNRAMRLHAAACSSFQRPVSWSEMRPSGLTAVASAMIRPAPPAAIAPRWTRCQSFGTPSRVVTEYWHSGGTHTRLRISSPRIAMGENSVGERSSAS